MKILIGGAWPYANGPLHIGHIAALLPGDILARYFRLKGHDVCYVSGSDCHGTPIILRARKEGVSPAAIAERYHEEFERCFKGLGFSYDYYGRTSSEEHGSFVRDFHKTLYGSGYVTEKTQDQAYCDTCAQFLPDRFVEGICPHCGKDARGDQCEQCGNVLDPEALLSPRCSICGGTPEFRPSSHLFLELSRLEEFLTGFVSGSKGWRRNAIGLSERYIKEGLRDRALTRDMEWGIDVPLEGYERKKIYIWAENILGYLSASHVWADQSGLDWSEFWGEEGRGSLHFYIHGKDNIPFHSIILTAMLKAHGGLHFPDRIVSSEYMTLEGQKISTSRNWAVWVPYILEKYQADSIRYFLTVNGPEKRDSDFSWREFVNRHNGELLGAFGNFVNRTLAFVEKSFGGRVPDGIPDKDILKRLNELFVSAGEKIEETEFKAALDEIFAFVRYANKYFDEKQPWAKLKTDPEDCAATLFNCIVIIGNLACLLSPFIPFACEKLKAMLNISISHWGYTPLQPGHDLGNTEVLFGRLDKKVIEEETIRLGGT